MRTPTFVEFLAFEILSRHSNPNGSAVIVLENVHYTNEFDALKEYLSNVYTAKSHPEFSEILDCDNNVSLIIFVSDTQEAYDQFLDNLRMRINGSTDVWILFLLVGDFKSANQQIHKNIIFFKRIEMLPKSASRDKKIGFLDFVSELTNRYGHCQISHDN